jgi:hypothetical protein
MSSGIGLDVGGSDAYRGLLAAAKSNTDRSSQKRDAQIEFTTTSLDRQATKVNSFVGSSVPGEQAQLQALQRGGLVDQFA